MPAVQGGSITKGIPGTRVHQEPPISYRGGSITQVGSFPPYKSRFSSFCQREVALKSVFEAATFL